VAEYLAPCVRDLDGDGDEDQMPLTVGNWCAAIQCFALRECLLPSETAPHKYRAGVVELISDAKLNGLWHPVKEVRSGEWTPSHGDLVIWDRSDPLKPETSWWRHVNRLTHFNPISQRLTTIGGNESRKIMLTDKAPKGLDHSGLIGFISYRPTDNVRPYTDDDRANDLALIAAFVETHRRAVA